MSDLLLIAGGVLVGYGIGGFVFLGRCHRKHGA